MLPVCKWGFWAKPIYIAPVLNFSKMWFSSDKSMETPKLRQERQAAIALGLTQNSTYKEVVLFSFPCFFCLSLCLAAGKTEESSTWFVVPYMNLTVLLWVFDSVPNPWYCLSIRTWGLQEPQKLRALDPLGKMLMQNHVICYIIKKQIHGSNVFLCC